MTERERLLHVVMNGMEQFLRDTDGKTYPYAAGADLDRDGVRQKVKEWLIYLRAFEGAKR